MWIRNPIQRGFYNSLYLGEMVKRYRPNWRMLGREMFAIAKLYLTQIYKSSPNMQRVLMEFPVGGDLNFSQMTGADFYQISPITIGNFVGSEKVGMNFAGTVTFAAPTITSSMFDGTWNHPQSLLKK